MFCRSGVEDRDHLFLFCSYSRRKWRSIMQLCGMARPPICWDNVILEGLQNWRRKVFKAHVCRLACGGNVYHIWRNRNALRHSNNPLSGEQLLQKKK